MYQELCNKTCNFTYPSNIKPSLFSAKSSSLQAFKTLNLEVLHKKRWKSTVKTKTQRNSDTYNMETVKAFQPKKRFIGRVICVTTHHHSLYAWSAYNLLYKKSLHWCQVILCKASVNLFTAWCTEKPRMAEQFHGWKGCSNNACLRRSLLHSKTLRNGVFVQRSLWTFHANRLHSQEGVKKTRSLHAFTPTSQAC